MSLVVPTRRRDAAQTSAPRAYESLLASVIKAIVGGCEQSELSDEEEMEMAN